MLSFVRSHWEDESAKLGDNFVIDAYVALQNEEVLRRAKALYSMRHSGKHSSSSSKVRCRLEVSGLHVPYATGQRQW